jgi:hypothetical protein
VGSKRCIFPATVGELIKRVFANMIGRFTGQIINGAIDWRHHGVAKERKIVGFQ